MIAYAIKDIPTAIRIFYEYPEIGNKEIRELFGGGSKSSIFHIKKLAEAKMAEKGVKSFTSYHVNTKCAYEAWGIDVDDLEKRYLKLKKLGMAPGQA